MNNFKISIRVLLFFTLFSACRSVSFVEYTPPDYSREQIRNKEIALINEISKNQPSYALWKSYVLLTSDESVYNDSALTLFKECGKTLLNAYKKAISDNDFLKAKKYYKSLKTLMPELITDEDSLFFNDEEVLFTKSNSITDTPVSTYIDGTVTVWVDLGIKVEKGLGYANRVIGSGFFIAEDGIIVTNHHVIADCVDPKYEGYSRVYVKLPSDPDTKIPAKVIGWDKSLDLALLKIQRKAPYVFELGTSENIRIGDTIYAIGSPIGLESTLTRGIVSSFDRKLLSTASVMQIDAAINAGNSGGPLIDKKGRVQGIVFAGIEAFEGLNFAIPIEYLKAILPRLYQKSSIQEPRATYSSWIGVYGHTKKDSVSKKNIGVEVLHIVNGENAFLSSLQEGDIIVTVDGIAVSTIEELQFEFIKQIPHSIIELGVKRNVSVDKKKLSIPIFLEDRPEYPVPRMRETESDAMLFYPLFGMKLQASSLHNRRQFIVTHIEKGSIADDSGFSVHDYVEIVSTKVLADGSFFYAEVFTKKRKSGYLDVNVAINAPMDSSLFF